MIPNVNSAAAEKPWSSWLEITWDFFFNRKLWGAASHVAPVVKNSPANAGDTRDTGSVPGWGRSPGEWNGNPLRYSCLGNPLDRGAWHTTVHGVARVENDWMTKQQQIFYSKYPFVHDWIVNDPLVYTGICRAEQGSGKRVEFID